MNAQSLASFTAIILATGSQVVTTSTFNNLLLEDFLNNYNEIVGSYSVPKRGTPSGREGAGTRFAPSPVHREA
ncbi:MAG TPA: hypothetical protein DDW76_11030 [Cyanobacteria bacterium UBA11369]|nr:hypothetical protein [Cyanobacteria bacterium UBA11371]HBE30905.1 hypothetical protein [Cyanobacteria bacterium UBA11368]HBE49303.1 hypothetical protein [Cyanobacteria bacterium UBA11369]